MGSRVMRVGIFLNMSAFDLILCIHMQGTPSCIPLLPSSMTIWAKVRFQAHGVAFDLRLGVN
jgi:hypothetical protein